MVFFSHEGGHGSHTFKSMAVADYAYTSIKKRYGETLTSIYLCGVIGRLNGIPVPIVSFRHERPRLGQSYRGL